MITFDSEMAEREGRGLARYRVSWGAESTLQSSRAGVSREGTVDKMLSPEVQRVNLNMITKLLLCGVGEVRERREQGAAVNHFDSLSLLPRICLLEVISICVGPTSFFLTGLQVSQGKSKFSLFLYPCHHHHRYCYYH